MKILRQKLFTFQDKKAFLEFYKATGGLKHLPKGKKGMRARDVYRIKNIAQKIDAGNLEGVNYDEARQILERIGLPESGKGIKHLIQKYKNIYDPEFQERFNRIYNQELNQIDKKTKNKLKRTTDLWTKYGISSPRNVHRIAEIERKIKKEAEIEKNQFVGRDISRSSGIVNDAADDWVYDAYYRSRDNPLLFGISKENLTPGTETREAMNAIMKKRRKIVPNIKIEKGSENAYIPTEGRIILTPKASSATVGHEIGHAISYKKGLVKDTRNMNNVIGNLAEENYATSQSNAIHNLAVKKGKISPTYAKNVEDDGDNSFQTYLADGINRINDAMYNNFPIYRRK